LQNEVEEQLKGERKEERQKQSQMGQTKEKNISISKGPKKEEKKSQRNKRSNLWLFGYIAF